MGADSPLLTAQRATQLTFDGRVDEAEHTLMTALTHWPAEAALHTQLARLRWQRGDGLESMREIRKAIDQYPRELHLRLVAADLLRSAGHAEESLKLLEGGLALAPDSATFRTSLGTVLEGLDRLDEALPLLREAHTRAPQSVAAARNLVPALLRTGAGGEALELCEELLGRFPDDQMLIALHSTALRVLGDRRYGELANYSRLVRVYSLEPVAPYVTLAEFNAAFARELAPLHRAARHPLEQSLRGGSQTEQHLPIDNPVFAAFFAMLDAPLRDYIGALRANDAIHPVDRRRGLGYRISGSWSVQLRAGGYHINHVHPRGWLSSAYYISLPDVSDANGRAGWLKFGEPAMNIAGCGPELFVQPAEGMLVLFPSYLWHGTVAFATGNPRLTAAFDVLPN